MDFSLICWFWFLYWLKSQFGFWFSSGLGLGKGGSGQQNSGISLCCPLFLIWGVQDSNTYLNGFFRGYFWVTLCHEAKTFWIHFFCCDGPTVFPQAYHLKLYNFSYSKAKKRRVDILILWNRSQNWQISISHHFLTIICRYYDRELWEV